MPAWLLTWTTYGTWLPGDPRGSVTRVRDGNHPRKKHNAPGTPYDGPMFGLQAAAQAALKGPPIYLNRRHADRLAAQFAETAAFRGWRLLALAVMANHVHLVTAADESVDPADMLRGFKSYGSRALNARCARPKSGTWWTASASRRLLPDERAVLAAIRYVREQPGALVVRVEPPA